jgi:hypothetical protein
MFIFINFYNFKLKFKNILEPGIRQSGWPFFVPAAAAGPVGRSMAADWHAAV